MALVTHTARNIGTSPITIGSYVVGASKDATIIGLFVSNVTTSIIKVSVLVNDGTHDTHIIKNMDVAVGGAENVMGGSEGKVTLKTGWSIKVISDTATSVDVIMTVAETAA